MIEANSTSTSAATSQELPAPPPPPPPPSRAATTGTALPLSAAARQRFPPRYSRQHDASPSPRPDPLLRRRSSLLSVSSISDATQSFAGDIIDPRTGRRGRAVDEENELSHWHSSPLAFAILPAIGGLIFKNGSAFVTDILLLGLAAIFMNWSIRLPWDWYYSAQAFRRDVEPDVGGLSDDLDDEIAIDTESSSSSSPKHDADPQSDSASSPPVQNIPRREEAAAELRRQELLALGATFLFPVLAAYILHVIRAQLSPSSTGLVSDYNLSIFLLAAEIRPVRQIVRLVSNRTLHLQRVMNGNEDFLSSSLEKANRDSLMGRMADLEARLSDHTVVPSTLTIAQKHDVNDLSTEIRKRYEPRLEGLERAMRRYEKRATTLALQTDDRLQSLELRLQDVVSLAAVAAKHSQNRGAFSKIADMIYTMIAVPLRIVRDICLWPLKALDELYWKIKTLLLGPAPPRPSTKRTNKSGRHESSSGTGREDKLAREKGAVRRVIR